MDRPLIYVAGPLTEPSPFDYIQHIADMNAEAEYLFEQGWAPIIPGNDFLLFYRSTRKWAQGEILEVDAAYIRACWAIRILGEQNNQGHPSSGVAYEITVAKESNVRICRTRKEVHLAYVSWLCRPGCCESCGCEELLHTTDSGERLCDICLTMCTDM